MSQTPYDIDDAPEDYFSDSDQSPYDAQPETTEDWLMNKSLSTEPTTIKPGTPVDILLCKDGQSFWVENGYKVFDPDQCFCSRNGHSPLQSDAAMSGFVLINRPADTFWVKPVAYSLARVRSHKPDAIPFQDIFCKSHE